MPANKLCVAAAPGDRKTGVRFRAAAPTPVIPLSDTEFYVDGRFNTRIHFTMDAAGKASGAVLNPGRWQQQGLKVD